MKNPEPPYQFYCDPFDV